MVVYEFLGSRLGDSHYIVSVLVLVLFLFSVLLEVVFVPHRQVVGLLLCISVGWAPSPFELAFGDEFYPSPFIMSICARQLNAIGKPAQEGYQSFSVGA